MNMSKKRILIILGGLALGLAVFLFAITRGKPSLGAGTAAATSAGSKDEHGHEEGKGDEHGTSEAGHDEGIVKKTPEDLQALGAAIAIAGPGKLATQVTLQGTLEPLPDSVVHIVPRVAGVVREVRKKLGDSVRKGETLAILESRDLADVKSAWLAAREKLSAAESALKREEELWNKKITSEQDYLNAKKTASEAHIEHSNALQKLESLGLSQAQLTSQGGSRSLIRYELKSPLAGVVVERHLTVGETTKGEEAVLIVAELSKVNAVLQVYPKDLPMIRKGLKGTIALANATQKASGEVTYVSPMLDLESRAAKAHLLLENAKGHFRPGLFVTATIDTDESEAAIVVPKESLQKVENKDVVFVQTDEGFVPSPVELGRSNNTHVEILSGLEAGEKFVTTGSFLLKAELAKSEAGHDHD